MTELEAQTLFSEVCNDLKITDWKLNFSPEHVDGHCWRYNKTIVVGALLEEARRLILHEIAHINTCQCENNKHCLEWCVLFANLCQKYNENPEEDGAYRFYKTNITKDGLT